MRILADVLKSFRKENNLTQEELGEIVGVTHDSICSWEAEKCFPNKYNMKKLLNFLDSFNLDPDKDIKLSRLKKKKRKKTPVVTETNKPQTSNTSITITLNELIKLLPAIESKKLMLDQAVKFITEYKGNGDEEYLKTAVTVLNAVLTIIKKEEN